MPESEEKKLNDIYDINHNLEYDGVRITGEHIIPNKYVDSNKIKDGAGTSQLSFFPVYSVTDYFKDLNNWRKQISPFESKGFFYFKIFFNFDTSYGLLGGKMDDATSVNTAYGYLSSIEDLPIYISENISARLEALKQFINALKTISMQTPWFFKEISNFNNINSVTINSEDFEKQSINITCSEESVDMRLGTLFDLYKYACYNVIRNKEILPANLRKFEMSILFMHVPLRKYQYNTGSSFKDKEINLNNADWKDNIISAKMYTFQNCEFDVKSMSEISDNISNENTFELGKNVIKINFDRVFEHRINEYEKIILNPEGYLLERDNNPSSRLEYIADSIKGMYINHTPNYVEKNIGESLYNNFTNIRSNYYRQKVQKLKEGTIKQGNIYHYNLGRIGQGVNRTNSNYLTEKLILLANRKEANDGKIYKVHDLGNIYNYSIIRNNGINTLYFEEKLKKLKNRRTDDNNIEIPIQDLGNIYGFKLGRTGYSTNRHNTKYLQEKLERFKNIYKDPEGNITKMRQLGNIYGFNLGRIGEADKRHNTNYLTAKVNRWKKGTITKGNLYGYDMGRIGEADKRHNTDYLDKKLSLLQSGNIYKGNLYGFDLGRIGEADKRHNTNYLAKKISVLKNKYHNLSSDNIYTEDAIKTLGTAANLDTLDLTDYLKPEKFGLQNTPILMTSTTDVNPNIISYGTANDLKPQFVFNENNAILNTESHPIKVPTTWSGDSLLYANPKPLRIKNDYVPLKYATENEFKLEWNANALNYSNNMFDVEGNPGTAKTWVGKLAESTWQRTKSAFGF